MKKGYFCFTDSQINPCVKKNAAITSVIQNTAMLNKLQRLACLATTWAMRITPTVAMEVHLGLLPLHVITEAEVQTAILCATISGNPNPLTTVTLKSQVMEHENHLTNED